MFQSLCAVCMTIRELTPEGLQYSWEITYRRNTSTNRCFRSCVKGVQCTLPCVHLPSLLMPKARHFCKRQCWQRLRLVRSIKQFLWREQEYMALFCWLRRKKPCTHTNTHRNYNKLLPFTSYKNISIGGKPVYIVFRPHLAAFTGDDSVVDSWGLIPTDLTGDDLDLSCRIKRQDRSESCCPTRTD